jgi:hypothetical protein
MDPVEAIMSFLGELGLTITVAAGVAYIFFRYMGSKWIEGQFEKQLEDYRHVHQRELEALRLEINKTMDRATKLHAREYEILPEVWGRLDEAFLQLRVLVSLFQESVDANRMTSEQLEAVLETSGFLAWQKQEIRSASDKGDAYFQFQMIKRRVDAANSYREFHNYLTRHSVFVHSNIKTKLSEVATMISKSIREESAAARGLGDIAERLQRSQLLHERVSVEGQKLVDDIETEISRRLWSLPGVSEAA